MWNLSSLTRHQTSALCTRSTGLPLDCQGSPSKERILGGFLDDSWMGTGHQKGQAMIRIVEFSAHNLSFFSGEREEGLDIELIFDHA